jgi:hypothetical protein
MINFTSNSNKICSSHFPSLFSSRQFLSDITFGLWLVSELKKMTLKCLITSKALCKGAVQWSIKVEVVEIPDIF